MHLETHDAGPVRGGRSPAACWRRTSSVIARSPLLTGVSRGTIGAIASGKRPDYQQLRRAPRRSIRWSRPGRPNAAPAAAAWSIIPAVLPRAEPGGPLPKPAAAAPTEPAGELLGLRLKEEHRLRYEEIHEAKRRAGEEHAAAAYDELILHSLIAKSPNP